MQIRYQRLHRMNPLEARRIIIETYERYASISATAREMETSRQVVRKWVQRYELEGEKGLSDRSRCPHISPRKTPYHPERLLCNRLGTPIFCPKDKRRVKRSSICLAYSAGRIPTTSYVWLRPGSMSTTSKGLTSVRAWVDCLLLYP
ncbi:MAG: helix-turn-helix domain-containing protein [Candidatus Stahlbacteria bacterium]|nr:MAG: helix-turn-helix domain-containing protein [Candidatus Stahlbacteria bacterium]